jgi:hypothetical protein
MYAFRDWKAVQILICEVGQGALEELQYPLHQEQAGAKRLHSREKIEAECPTFDKLNLAWNPTMSRQPMKCMDSHSIILAN